MPFKIPSIQGRASNEQKKEASLDDILPHPSQRVDLIVLVIVCIDHMRDILTAAFENHESSKAATQSAKNQEFWIDDDKRGTQSQENRLDLQWGKNMELSSQRMQDLKKNGVAHINRWRTTLLRRMGEALSVRPDAVKRAKAEYTSKESTTAYHSWAEGEDPLDTSSQIDTEITLPFPKVNLPGSIKVLEDKNRALVLGAVLFLLLSLGNYSAYSRVLLSYLSQCLALPYDVLTSEETTTAVTLLKAAGVKDGAGMDAEEARQRQADQTAFSRRFKIGLATVAGAVAIGVTGGLAAPLLLGVAGTIMGGIGLGGLATLLGATIANPITIGALFGALGGRMTSSAMTAYSKEVQDFKFLPVHEEGTHSTPTTKDSSSETRNAPHKLRVAIGISGWVVNESDIVKPWRVLSSTTVESFALRYEQEALTSLGTTLDDTLKNTAYSVVQSSALQLVLPAVATAMLPIGLLRTGKFLDNPFTIAMERSDKAGKVLAHALIDKAQGERPVTLIGFSLGARVIFSCLEELAAENAFGLVENAILIGAPVPSSEMSWRRMKSMTSGRLINVYTQRDMLLGFLYRARNIQFGIAGLEAITSAPNIENKDVSHIVTGHNQYRLATGRILKELNFQDLDLEQVEQESAKLEDEKLYEKKVHDEAKQEGRLKGVEDENGKVVMCQVATADQTHEEWHPLGAGHSQQELPKKLEETRLADNTSPTSPLLAQKAETSIRPHGHSESKEEDEEDDEEEDGGHQPIQMLDIEPEAIPDSPVAKTSFDSSRPVRFGSAERGIDLTWNEKSR